MPKIPACLNATCQEDDNCCSSTNCVQNKCSSCISHGSCSISDEPCCVGSCVKHVCKPCLPDHASCKGKKASRCCGYCDDNNVCRGEITKSPITGPPICTLGIVNCCISSADALTYIYVADGLLQPPAFQEIIPGNGTFPWLDVTHIRFTEPATTSVFALQGYILVNDSAKFNPFNSGISLRCQATDEDSPWNFVTTLKNGNWTSVLSKKTYEPDFPSDWFKLKFNDTGNLTKNAVSSLKDFYLTNVGIVDDVSPYSRLASPGNSRYFTLKKIVFQDPACAYLTNVPTSISITDAPTRTQSPFGNVSDSAGFQFGGSIGGTVGFLTAFFALATMLIMIKRRTSRRVEGIEAVRKNRKLATRKSLSSFMGQMQKIHHESIIDPQRLDLGRVIGVGSHGVVYEGRYQGENVAVKELVLEEQESSKMDKQRFLNEMLALSILQHPNITRLIGIGVVESDIKITGFQTFFFVMELLECSLRDVLEDDILRRRISSLQQALSIAKQILEGLSYIHSKNLVHYDLKPENILLEGDVVKICDFGLSEVETVRFHDSENVIEDLHGSAPYIAPELVTDYRKNASRYQVNSKADVYSFGIVLWEILHAPLPSHPTNWDPYRILVETKYCFYRPKIDPSVPKPIHSIITSCWEEDPSDRPTVVELIDTLTNGYSSTIVVPYVQEEVTPRRYSASSML